MFSEHKIATTIGAVGAAIVLGHVALGPSIVPVIGALSGALLVAASALFFAFTRRRASIKDRPSGDRSESI